MVDKSELDKVVDRVRKLLALSKSANENEAGLAMERAQELLAKHNLDMSAVDEQREAPLTIDDEVVTDSYPWRRIIGTGIAQLYFCRYCYGSFINGKTSYDRHVFVGERHNIMVAKLMFGYLCNTVDRLARAAAKPLPKTQRSPFRVSFRSACSARLQYRMVERMRDTSARGLDPLRQIAGTQLPALQSLYEQKGAAAAAFMKEQMGMALTPKLAKVDTRDPAGLVAGAKAGDGISLDQQVAASKRAQIQ